MNIVKCLWHTCIDAYFFGLKEDSTFITKNVNWHDGRDYEKGYWYFDEIEQNHGPFNSYRKCIKSFKMHIEYLEHTNKEILK